MTIKQAASWLCQPGIVAMIHDPTTKEALSVAVKALAKRKEESGQWRVTEDCGDMMYECSECEGRMFKKSYDHAVGTEGYNYCPYCGASMKRKTK